MYTLSSYVVVSGHFPGDSQLVCTKRDRCRDRWLHWRTRVLIELPHFGDRNRGFISEHQLLPSSTIVSRHTSRGIHNDNKHPGDRPVRLLAGLETTAFYHIRPRELEDFTYCMNNNIRKEESTVQDQVMRQKWCVPLLFCLFVRFG